jgi:hypothetical protein
MKNALHFSILISLSFTSCLGYDELEFFPVNLEFPENTRPDSLTVGDTVQLLPTMRDQYNRVPELSDLSWSSSNTTVLSINNQGVAQGNSVGVADITATLGTVSQSFSIVVTMEMVDNSISDTTQLSGTFTGVGGYQVNGGCVFTPLSNGSFELTFDEQFSVSSSGIALNVHLSSDASSTGVDLGSLKNVSGTQTYAVPAGFSVSDNPFVVIYCQPAGIPFGHAELK